MTNIRDYHALIARYWTQIEKYQKELHALLEAEGKDTNSELPTSIAMKLYRVDTKLTEAYATMSSALYAFHKLEEKTNE